MKTSDEDLVTLIILRVSLTGMSVMDIREGAAGRQFLEMVEFRTTIVKPREL